MAIVKMKHLQLIAMGSDREALLRLFQRMGCVEIDQICVESPGDTQGGTGAPEERQALLRLPKSRAVVFSIHTTVVHVDQVAPEALKAFRALHP